MVGYGVTAQLLLDVPPIDDALAPCTIREHVFKVAERLEQALGEEQWLFIDSCPAEWSRLPIPRASRQSRTTVVSALTGLHTHPNQHSREGLRVVVQSSAEGRRLVVGSTAHQPQGHPRALRPGLLDHPG